MGWSGDKLSIFVRVFLSKELVRLVGLAVVAPNLENMERHGHTVNET